MDVTGTRLGGIEIGSSVMNASGARSAERGEINELCAVHSGPLVFKSCNLKGLDAPESLKNRGVEHFASIAKELVARGKIVFGSIVGASEEEFVEIARALDRAGVHAIEMNLADDYVINAVAPFASLERLKALLGRVRGEIGAVMAVKLPMSIGRDQARPLADLLKLMRVAIAVCHNDLPKDLEVNLKTHEVRGESRALSQAHAFYRESEGLLDVVAAGGVSGGRDAFLAHLAGATAVQVGSALMKEGAGALGRIDRELAEILAEHGCRSVSEIIGRLRFTG